jgi:kynureninase
MHRTEFYVPGPGPYALTHSVGCLPIHGAAAIERHYLQPWRHQGGDAWPAWLCAIDEFRESLAALLGGDAADYCPQDCFPSMAFVLQMARAVGYETRLIPRAQDASSIAPWRDALTSEVAAALVTHVHSNTGIVAPVADIGRGELRLERGIQPHEACARAAAEPLHATTEHDMRRHLADR